MDSALRPRDIQARIRSGETPEAVAAAAQTSLDSIMAFAEPVLAERAHIARTAQASSIRRRSADSSTSARALGDAATAYCERHDLDQETLDWDAWRRGDGRWMLVAEFSINGLDRHAEFTYDSAGRYVVADNDDARRLTGELSEGAADAPIAGNAPRRRLTAVPHYDDELPLGDDALDLVRESRPGEASASAAAAELPAEEPTVEVPLVGDADAESTHGAVDQAEPENAPSETAPAADEKATGKPKGAAGRSRKRGRPSVPSWDEIMFGGKDEPARDARED